MRILLDTNVLIKVGMKDRLPLAITEALEDAAILVTPLSRAEIALKHALQKLPLPHAEPEFWRLLIERLDAQELPFTSSHAARLAAMPLHHRDPFDRMILAQALVEDLTVATTDAGFARYGVRVLGLSSPEP